MKGLLPIILAVLACLTGCTNDMREVRALTKPKIGASQVGDSVVMLYSDSTQLKLMVKANKMLVYDKNVLEPFTVLPSGVFVTFYDEEGNVSATLKARYGIRFDKSRRMEAKNAVEVVNRKGEKLETEKLTWDEKTKKIHTDAFVKITTDKQVIMGTGMESNQDFSKYQIRKVTGVLQLNEDGI